MLSSRNEEDLDPALTPEAQQRKKIDMELQSLRNGILAAHKYAEDKVREGIQAKTELREIEQELERLIVKNDNSLMFWKLATCVQAVIIAALIFGLAITNL